MKGLVRKMISDPISLGFPQPIFGQFGLPSHRKIPNQSQHPDSSRKMQSESNPMSNHSLSVASPNTNVFLSLPNLNGTHVSPAVQFGRIIPQSSLSVSARSSVLSSADLSRNREELNSMHEEIKQLQNEIRRNKKL